MATSTTGKQARKATTGARATTRARSTARAGAQAAKRGTGGAKPVRAQASREQRGTTALVRDGAYAVVGLGDQAVEVLRGATRQADEVRARLPEAVRAIGPRARSLAEVAPGAVASGVTGLVTAAGAGFDSYAKRGRSLLESVSRGRPTRRAAEQARAARSQVRAARTSVGKAVEQSVDAAGAAADKVGQEGRAGN